MTNKLEELVKLENRFICIFISIAALFVLLPCFGVVHYALTIPSAVILLSLAVDFALKQYIRKRVKNFDKS
ncbi:hypothetical protein BSL056_09200 [Bacillus safensis]|nr:hypothetical protein BSL056_09200 [Bacillus safensis]